MSTWVLLRGLTREARHWGDFPDQFRAEVADATVVALDLPGNGRRNALASPDRVEAMVDCYRAALHAQGVAPPYGLLALSLGGMVAVAWAAAHPDDVRAAVLINTSLRPYSAFHERLRPASIPDLVALILAGDDAERCERLILALTSHCRNTDRDLLARWASWRREHPVSSANALRQLLAAARYRAPTRKPPPPMLVLASAGDRLVSSRCSVALADRWRTPLAIHPSAGHDLPLDDGVWVARQVRDWLATAGA